MNKQPETPSLEQRAFDLFRPPFRYYRSEGTFRDTNGQKVAVAALGGICHVPDPERLQDAAALLLAEAMTFYWNHRKFGPLPTPDRFTSVGGSMRRANTGPWVRWDDYRSMVGAWLTTPPLNWSAEGEHPLQRTLSDNGELIAANATIAQLTTERDALLEKIRTIESASAAYRRNDLADKERLRVELESCVGWLEWLDDPRCGFGKDHKSVIRSARAALAEVFNEPQDAQLLAYEQLCGRMFRKGQSEQVSVSAVTPQPYVPLPQLDYPEACDGCGRITVCVNDSPKCCCFCGAKLSGNYLAPVHVFTEQSLAAALGKVRCLHDLGAELIAAEVFSPASEVPKNG